ncbi:MAG: NmrA family NAD(P)-binding protein [Pseudomonadota bacterium]
MRKKVTRALVLLAALLAVLYGAVFAARLGDAELENSEAMDTGLHRTVAIFGATGTIGDGLLKAVINDPATDTVYVLTRRSSPRIDAGVASGDVTMVLHTDYQDYSAVEDILAEVDSVYWAIGLSAAGLDEDTYREIHVTLPTRFLSEWLASSSKPGRSFHYVSGGGADADSRMMWAREKARAEGELSNLAKGSTVRVVSYRPSFILPTDAEVHIGHRVVYAIFAPLKLAVAAESIGEAMLEVSARGDQLPSGAVLENGEIVGYREAYTRRQEFARE